MNADEKRIYEMLKASPHTPLSVTEISKRLGRGRLFEQNRNWARPILLRMELDGLVESNPFGEYSLRDKPDDSTNFYKALEHPGVDLGDTTIIRLDESRPKDGNKATG